MNSFLLLRCRCPLLVASLCLIAVPSWAQQGAQQSAEETLESPQMQAITYGETPVGQALVEELKLRRAALETLFATRAQLSFAVHKLQTLQQQSRRVAIEKEIDDLRTQLQRQGEVVEDIVPPANPVTRIVNLSAEGQSEATVEVETESGNKQEISIRIGSTIHFGADKWLIVGMNRATGIQMLHAESNTLQTISIPDHG